MARLLTERPNAIKDQSHMEQALASVLCDVRNALGQTTCWPLGDIVIALQVPESCALWSRDADFDVLCSVFNRQRFTPGV